MTIRHYHLVRPDGSFSQSGHRDGEAPHNPDGHLLVYVDAHVGDLDCHRYVDGRLEFDAEKRARIDREIEIIVMPRLQFFQLIEKMIADSTADLEARIAALENPKGEDR